MQKIELMNVEKRIKNIINEWFYSEPLLFFTFCSHTLIKNSLMKCPLRSGVSQKCFRLEYNPEILTNFSEINLTEALKIEGYRILLSHPYKRQPYNANKTVLVIASDIVINQFYKTDFCLAGIEYLKSLTKKFKEEKNPLGVEWSGTEEEKFFMKNLNIDHRTGRFFVLDNLSFEEWYKKILFLLKHISFGGENAGSSSLNETAKNIGEAGDLWEENEEALADIQKNIQKVEVDQGWGGLGGSLKREILEQADFSMDFRKALTLFRQNIINASRTLTRMKPSRRFGFKAMGSRYKRKADVLIAVDVSGSITDESFNRFFKAINNIFFLGIIEKIDVIFFDTVLKFSEPIPFKKKIKLKEISGRGGTDFQCAVDYFSFHKDYDGLIIFTDGKGDCPVIHGKKNILWVLTSRIDYENAVPWISTLNGNRATFMPF